VLVRFAVKEYQQSPLYREPAAHKATRKKPA
jgi:hypothetical protein